MEHIRAADAETMQRVEGIGTEKAPSIVAELAELAPLIDKLAAAGVNMTEPGATPPVATDDADGAAQGAEPTGGPLTGMAVVVTGAFPVKFFCAEFSDLGAGVLRLGHPGPRRTPGHRRARRVTLS
jgi:NAD-dependent DNA ligase